MTRISCLILFGLIGFQSCSGQAHKETESKDLRSNQEVVTTIDSKDSLAIKGVKSIPPNVFNRTELKYLFVWGQDCDISGRECFAISEIPKEIKKLENLEELHLPLNYITKLPIEILELKNLKVIDLSENPGFADIETVSQMNWLEEFYCFGCHLSESDIEKLKTELPDCKIKTE